MLLTTYGFIGLLGGLSASFLMHREGGNPWLAVLIGVDGALTGQYFTGRYFSSQTPGAGSALFLAAMGSLLLLSVYRTAFRWKVDAESGPIRS